MAVKETPAVAAPTSSSPADFSAVTEAFTDARTVAIHGQATILVDTQVTATINLSSADGSTEIVQAVGERQVTTPQPTRITSVTDDAGRTYVVAADGQTAQATTP